MLKSLNDLKEEDLQTIEDCASCFLTPKEIAIILEFEINFFVSLCNQEGSDCYNRYQRGFLKSEFELRKSIVTLAIQGSSPAQTLSMDMVVKSRLKRNET